MVTTVSLLLASFGLNGFTEAVIQFEEIDHYTASNLFWLNLGGGLVLASTLYGQLFMSHDAGDSWRKVRQEFSEVRSLAWMPS